MKFPRGQAKQYASIFEINILFSLLLGNTFKRNNMIRTHKDIYIRIFIETPFIKEKLKILKFSELIKLR